MADLQRGHSMIELVFCNYGGIKRARERGCEIGVYAAATVGEETVKTGHIGLVHGFSRQQPSL